MFPFVYGLAFSLCFWFTALDLSLFVQILPLLCAAAVSALYTMYLIRSGQNFSLHVAVLATAALITLLLWASPDGFYFVFTLCFGMIVLLYVLANASELFLGPRWLALGNLVSLVLSAVTYMLFYAAIQNHTPDWLVFVFVGLLFAVELFIIYHTQKMEDLTEEKIYEMTLERIGYLAMLFMVTTTSVLYTFDVIDLKLNLAICVVLYALVLVSMVSVRLAEHCCRNARGWRQLRNSDINTSSGP